MSREGVQRRLSSDHHRVVGDLVAAVTGRVPAYRGLAGAQLDEVEAIAAWASARIIELWVHDRALDPADIARFRGIGAARALDGRPIDAVLRAYQVAGTQLFELVMSIDAGDTLEVDDVAALTRVWMNSLSELTDALWGGYTAASVRLTNDRWRAVADLFDDLLSGRHATYASIADRCERLGLQLPERPQLVLIRTTHAATAVTEEDLAELFSELAIEDEMALCRAREPYAVALIPPLPAPALRDAAQSRGWHGCVISHGRLEDTARSYRLAHTALKHAPLRVFRRRPMLNDSDALVIALLAGTSDVDLEQVSSAILATISDQPHLLAGLDAFLSANSANEAAELLQVHPQTMRYRLRRITERTGYDPRDPWGRFILEVASTIPTRR